ncbi:hypothetical protein GCM10009557_01300 [Virgisporangium ochraceum]|uniref:Uncharacterized protein n=1 Tax=Virgisporangium ochraceum TaxID=65505 RepID=A0A8J4A2Y7_9ACTN|nr:hypothetical protein [Virgisporangium ochraceum]GIJ74161.1 hypothetical protein Voc01_090780 [Virgisporangium ochraceum]
MGSRNRRQRRQLDRAGIATHVGVSSATVDHWYLHRDRTGFPDRADTDSSGRDWWWQTEIDAFYTAHLTARAATFTEVDRSGDPGDRLTAPQAAKVLGYKDHRSLPNALRHHPDDTEQLPSGRLRRYWYRRTVWAYADGRSQRRSTGRPTGIGRTQYRPPRYIDDPRLDAARTLLGEARSAQRPIVGLGAELARLLSVPERTAQRLIMEALRHD